MLMQHNIREMYLFQLTGSSLRLAQLTDGSKKSIVSIEAQLTYPGHVECAKAITSPNLLWKMETIW